MSGQVKGWVREVTCLHHHQGYYTDHATRSWSSHPNITKDGERKTEDLLEPKTGFTFAIMHTRNAWDTTVVQLPWMCSGSGWLLCVENDSKWQTDSSNVSRDLLKVGVGWIYIPEECEHVCKHEITGLIKYSSFLQTLTKTPIQSMHMKWLQNCFWLCNLFWWFATP